MVTASGPGGGNPVGGDAARRAAQAELRRVEYHREQGYAARVVHWLTDKIGRFFSGTSSADHAMLVFAVIVLVVAIVLAVRAGRPRHGSVGRGAPGNDPLAPVPARDHRRLAQQYAAEGRRAEALREWLRAAVRSIEDRGVLPPRPGRTGAATAREAGPALPAAADALAAATTAFDEIWFGGRAATDADVAHGQAAADGAASARIVAGAAAADGIAVPW
ncbi:MAG TPA: DUF4129 domain-containing protein [Jatrophihabitans sp.]|uniref:DUF4129 domain-containing protein n=1 Tax=Jatrophihabitans sp. TaxID=1932789 RepID=UPI002DF94ED8|nr:DUF4129 domain-containing protein [Jatrophihabitans sp.]